MRPSRFRSRVRSLCGGAFSVCLLFVAATGAAAHTLDAPPIIMADPDGAFAYDITITAGPGDAVIASWYWVGQENIFDGLFADCFCDPGCPLAEGATIVENVAGALDNAALPGEIVNGVEFCSAGSIFHTTTVLPFSVSTPGADVTLVPTLASAPNPFRSATRFTYTLPLEGRVTLRVYDVHGRLVASLRDRIETAGVHGVTWGGDANGTRVTPGTYFAVLDVAGSRVTRRVVLTD